MTDASQQESNDGNDTCLETAFCIKQEPLEIDPDDFLEAKYDSISVVSDTQKASPCKENFQLEVMAIRDVDGNSSEPGRKRKKILKRSSKRLKITAKEDVDDNAQGPFRKRCRKSKRLNISPETTKLSFQCPRKYCEFSCASVKALDSHTRLRHEEANLKVGGRRKPRKIKDVAKAVPAASLSDGEVESTSKPEVVDVSGFVVRIEKIYNKGRVMYACSRCKNVFRKRETCEAHIAKVHMNIKRYTCSDCGRGFDRALDLEEHNKVHTRERPFKCPAENCTYTASWTGTLYKHVRRRHKDYQGDLTLATVAKGELSKRKVRDNNPVANEPAGSVAKTDETIEAEPDNEDSLLVQIPPVEDVENDSGQLDLYEEANIIDNRNDNVPHYACKICSKDFENLYSIKRHVNEAHIDVKKRTCLTCGITLSYRYNLNVHMRSHSGERPHKCGECGKGFLSTSDLKRHARRLQHASGMPKKEHKCIICKENFDSSGDLEQHASIHALRVTDLNDSYELTPYEEAKLTVSDSSESHVYTCNICGMQFSVLSAAKDHVNKDHKDVKNHSCIYCGSTSNSRTAMRKHMLIHEGNKTFKCLNSHCNYATEQYANLQQHFRDCANISKRAAVRKCTICCVEFGELSVLRAHFKVAHKLANSYSCVHCEYSFGSLGDLTEHILSHGAIQSVVRCPIENCQFIVTSEEDRRKHQQWHEKKNNPLPRPFVCGTCGKDFDRNASLMRHMRNIHSK
ncbi:zinc finger protein 93-like [Ochlerotatus camptorhynchus]|uniref:zinc finger protein 93-like n=1 Tax=Ochlerotatus camptorhynchus TaxID=644619 RepID=UPI0031DC99AE